MAVIKLLGCFLPLEPFPMTPVWFPCMPGQGMKQFYVASLVVESTTLALLWVHQHVCGCGRFGMICIGMGVCPSNVEASCFGLQPCHTHNTCIGPFWVFSHLL